MKQDFHHKSESELEALGGGSGSGSGVVKDIAVERAAWTPVKRACDSSSTRVVLGSNCHLR